MAVKKAKSDYTLLVLCAITSVGLAVAFMFLRANCMSKQDNDFVDKYCLDMLPDNRIRALASGIVTAAVLLLVWALKAMVCAFRTHSLERGIPEGVYVALGGQAWKYQAAVFRRKGIAVLWRLAVTTILLMAAGKELFQPLLSQAQRSQVVYIKTLNNATVFNHTSYYNVSGGALQGVQIDPESGFTVLSKLGEFSGGSNSFSTGKNRVSTTVVRSGFINQRDIADIANAGLALNQNETVARIDSFCGNLDNYTMPLATFLAIQSGTGVSFSTDLSPTSNALSKFGYVYDIQFLRADQDNLVAATHIKRFQCLACDAQMNVDILETMCSSNLTLTESQFIFTVASQNISVIASQSSSTTVSPSVFSEVVKNYSKSLEGLEDLPGQVGIAYNTALVGDVSSTFLTGYFNSSDANFLHSRLCVSVSYALNYLWTNYNISIDVNGVVTNGNSFTLFDVPMPLYNPVNVVYLSEGRAWAIVCSFAVPTIVLCLLGIFYTYYAKMNIKGSNENALLDNMHSSDLDERRRSLSFKDGANRVQRPAKASNDEEEQLELAFDTFLYCVEHEQPNPFGAGKELMVRLFNSPAGQPDPVVNGALAISKVQDYS